MKPASLSVFQRLLGHRAERIISLTWLFQFMLFGGGGLMFLLSPKVTLGTLRMGGRTDFDLAHADPQAVDLALCGPAGQGWLETFVWSWNCDAALVVSEVRFIGAYVVMAALFSGLGLMFTSVRFRRGLAVTLGTFIAFWSGAFIKSYLTGRYGMFAMMAYGVPAFCTTALNWVYVLAVVEPEEEKRQANEVLGGEDTKPPWLWFFWILQGVLLIALGLFRLIWPGHYLKFWLGSDGYDAIAPFVGLAADQVGIIASYTLGLGMMSFLALKTIRAWEWRTFARLFAACQLTLLIAGIVNVSAGYGTVLSTFPAWVGGLLVLANLAASRRWREWYEDDAASEPQGWTFMDLVAGPLMWIQMLRQRRRASHLVGVAATGTATVEAHNVPQNDLFNAEARPLTATLRFANLTLLDDRGLDVRGAALRLSDGDRPVMDFMMNTGVMCPAPHLVAFGLFVLSKWFPTRLKKMALLGDRIKREDGQAGLRYAPASYAGLRFHSQMVTHWVERDGTLHCARYRLRPPNLEDHEDEDGIPPDDILAEAWKREPRSPVLNRIPRSDYLRQGLRDQLRDGTVTLVLEAQIHTPEVGHGRGCYAANVEWPVRTHPWRHLATVTLDTALSDEDAERLRFRPDVRPSSLPIPKADGPLDPRSLASSEARVVSRLGRLREHMVQRSGLPKFGEVT